MSITQVLTVGVHEYVTVSHATKSAPPKSQSRVVPLSNSTSPQSKIVQQAHTPPVSQVFVLRLQTSSPLQNNPSLQSLSSTQSGSQIPSTTDNDSSTHHSQSVGTKPESNS